MSVKREREAVRQGSVAVPVKAGHFLGIMAAAIVVFAAWGHMLSRPGLSIAMLVLFGVIYLTAAITLRQPLFVRPGLGLLVVAFLVLCHAAGASTSTFPLLSLVPLTILFMADRYSLRWGRAAYARNVLVTMDLVMVVFAIVLFAGARSHFRATAPIGALTLGGYALLLQSAHLRTKGFWRLTWAAIAAVTSFLFFAVAYTPMALLAAGVGLALMGMLLVRHRIASLRAPGPVLLALALLMGACSLWSETSMFAGVALIGFSILLMNLGDIRHLRAGIGKAVPFYVVGGIATLLGVALSVRQGPALSVAFLLFSVNCFGLSRALETKSRSGLEQLIARVVLGTGLVGALGVIVVAIQSGLAPSTINIVITAFYGFLFLLLGRGIRRGRLLRKVDYFYVATAFLTWSGLMVLWRFGPLHPRAHNFLIAPPIFWGLALLKLIRSRRRPENGLDSPRESAHVHGIPFGVNYVFELMTLGTAFSIPGFSSSTKFLLCLMLSLGYAVWWAVVREYRMVFPLVLAAAFLGHQAVHALGLGSLVGSISMAVVAMAAFAGVLGRREQSFDRHAKAMMVIWVAFAFSSVSVSLSSASIAVCVMALWTLPFVAAAPWFQNWGRGGRFWLVAAGSAVAVLAFGMAWSHHLLTEAIFVSAVIALAFAIPAALARWDVSLYTAGVLAIVSWVLATARAAGIGAFSVSSYVPILAFLVAERLSRRPFAARAFGHLGHLSVFSAVGLWLTAGTGFSPPVMATVFLGFSLLYAWRMKKGEHALNLFAAGALLVIAYRFLLVWILGPGHHYSILNLSIVPIAATAWLVGRRVRGSAHFYLYALAIAVALTTSVLVTAHGPPTEGKWVVLLSAGLYLVLLVVLRRNMFVYFSTFALTLLAYNLLREGGDHFLQELVTFFLYVQGVLGLLFLFPFMQRHMARRAPFSFLIVQNRKGAAFLVAPILLLAALSLAFYSTEVTQNPRFCNSCHNMGEAYTTWQQSPHNDIACVKCHIAPGAEQVVRAKIKGMRETVQYATDAVPPRPHAQVEDEACLRAGCHQTSALSRESTPFKNMGHFPHKAHLGLELRGMRLRCASCHAHATGAEHFEIDEHVCHICHFSGRGNAESAIGSCRTCHELPEAGPFVHEEFCEEQPGVPCTACHSSVTQGEATVRMSACKACHSVQPEGADDVARVHRVHVTTVKVGCYRCHEVIVHGTNIGFEYGDSCEQCHGAAFHGRASQVYAGLGGQGVTATPSAMFTSGVSCGACHGHEVAVPVMSTPGWTIREACDECHGEGTADFIEDWQQDTRKQLEATGSLLAQVNGRLAGADTTTQAAAALRALLTAAQQNYDLVLQDGSYGVHNPEFVAALLEQAQADLHRAIEPLSTPASPPET